MDAYCSFEDAFVVPTQIPKKKKVKAKDIPGNLDPDRISLRPPPVAEVLQSSSENVPTATANTIDFFPLPGETAGVDAWEKVFMLEPDWAKSHGLPSSSTDGKSNLWRSIPPVQHDKPDNQPSNPTMAAMSEKLENLSRQLEMLSIPTTTQSTAELFLFVAIGLLILLIIDTLLRYATTIASSRIMIGGKHMRYAR